MKKASKKKWHEEIVWGRLLIVIGVIFVIFFCSLSFFEFFYEKKGDRQDRKIKQQTIIRARDQITYFFEPGQKQVSIQLKKDDWSGWIKLPPNMNFRIISPGHLEMLIWSGKTIQCGIDSLLWLGKIDRAIFKLKGEGRAEVLIEKM